MLPIVLLVLLAIAGVTGWIVMSITRPPQRPYLVTPDTFSQLSSPLKATDETWSNRDGTPARGWLIRGTPGAPAVILFHRYGADRSWLLNLSVKLNEATNFTVLWPDLRGHGPGPEVKWTSFGASETDDAAAAVDYVRSLKTPSGERQVGDAIGLYGAELGGYAALGAATSHGEVRALVLDSLPASPDDLVNGTVAAHLGMDNGVLRKLARTGIHAYFMGKFKNSPSCEFAKALQGKRVLLLSGSDAGYLRQSTVALEACFSQAMLETKTDLPLSGLNLPSATGQIGEGYDRRVIDFFDKALRGVP
jgi:hypothetical protein